MELKQSHNWKADWCNHADESWLQGEGLGKRKGKRKGIKIESKWSINWKKCCCNWVKLKIQRIGEATIVDTTVVKLKVSSHPRNVRKIK